MRALSSHRLASFAAVAGALALPAAGAALPVADYTQPAKRDTEPVILTGKDFPDWGARANVTAKEPVTDVPDAGGCLGGFSFGGFGECTHNDYAEPDVDSGNAAGEGTPVDRLLGYRWDGTRFVQIPFQVDEMFTRYLDNTASGFAIYSGEDQHTTYAFDREGFRFTEDGPSDNPCLAQPTGGRETTPDPSLVWTTTTSSSSWRATPAAVAPAGAKLPQGVEELRRVEINDPTDPAERARSCMSQRRRPDGADARVRRRQRLRPLRARRQRRTSSRSRSRATTTTAMPRAARSATRTATSSQHERARAGRATTRRSRPTATGSATTGAG